MQQTDDTMIEARLAADLLAAMPDFSRTPTREHPPIMAAQRQVAVEFWLRHGVAGLVVRTYTAASLAQALDGDGFARLQAAAAAMQRRAMVLLTVLRELLLLAESMAIPLTLFKGLADARDLYGDLGARQISDLDLIVPVARRDDLIAALLAHGWQLRGTYADLGPVGRRWYLLFNHAVVLVHAGSGTCLDLHWRINELPLLDVDEQRWVETRSEPTRLAGQPCLVLRPADRYLALLTHAARSEVILLRWWADLVRARQLALAALGAEAFAQALDAAGGARLDGEWLASCRRLAGAGPVPPGSPEYWLLRQERPSPSEQFGRLWRLRSAPRFRLALLLRECMRWQDLDVVRLPDAWFPLYFLLRWPFMVVRRLWRLLLPRA